MNAPARPTLLRTILALLLAATASLDPAEAAEASSNESSTASAAPSESRPNVVLIVADDMGWTDFGFMGSETIRTPRLDRLASESILFERGYVPGSLCRCSLASIVTGLYPHQNRITANDPPRGTDRREMLRFIAEAPTLPRLLAERGYVSLQTGKWWEGSYELGGFTEGMTHGDPARGGRHGDEGLRVGREGLGRVERFLKDHRGTPFFVWYAPMLPHQPHDPPARFLDRHRDSGVSIHVAKYRAMCEWFDETCGELLDLLEREGVAGETLVAFVVDNGWGQREDAPGFDDRSKRSPYDGGLRTPVLVRLPGRVPPRREAETPVMSLDLTTTILRACGARVPEELPGIDLLAAPVSVASARDAVFGEIFQHDAVDLERPAASLQWRWMIEGRWKAIFPHASAAPPMLFDLTADPFEREDLAAREPERLLRMRRRTDAWWNPEADSASDARP